MIILCLVIRIKAKSKHMRLKKLTNRSVKEGARKTFILTT